MDKKPIGVQLFTLREEMETDLAGTLRRVGEIGYDGVELWFPGSKFPPVQDLKKMLEDAGLTVASAHVPLDMLKADFQDVIGYQTELGNKDVTVPNIPNSPNLGDVGWRQVVDDLIAVGKKCNDAGFRLSYHNHAVEFEMKVGEMEVHDFIFTSVDASLLKAQLDTYFIEVDGKSPAEYIRKFSGRVPLLHLKDRNKNADKYINAEIGGGTVDWDSVLNETDGAGVEWHIVEQRCQEFPIFESIQMSLEFLRSKGLG